MRRWTSLSAPASFRGAVLPLHLAVKVIFNVPRGENKDKWGDRTFGVCVCVTAPPQMEIYQVTLHNFFLILLNFMFSGNH